MSAHLFPLLEYLKNGNHIVQVIEAISGDDLAMCATLDLAEENDLLMHPFEVGKAYLVYTTTLYFVGKVTQVTPCWLVMEDCSWVHWTGRLSTLMSKQSFDHADFPDGERKPRTEYMGNWTVAIGSMVGYGEWPVDKLPKTSI